MKRLFFSLIILIFLLGPSFASSVEIGNNMDPIFRYAWSEAGLFDFGKSGGNVYVSNTGLTGYAWSDEKGWISLSCLNTGSCAKNYFKVSNDGKGNLSGYAWGEYAGWINFEGVTIDKDGYFHGIAFGYKTGQINFNCITANICNGSKFRVRTNWRPNSVIFASSSLSQNNINEANMILASEKYIIDVDVKKVINAGEVYPDAVIIEKVEQSEEEKKLLEEVAILVEEKVVLERFIFQRNLDFKDKGDDVKELQKFLNNNGFVIAESGSGSKGNETNLFGKLTVEALKKFQEEYKEDVLFPTGLRQATGYFGPSTRGFVNSFAPKPKYQFTKELKLEDKNDDVKKLQEFLAQDKEVYPEGITSGYFGSLTQKAIGRFQLKHNIVSSSASSGYGLFGPRTMAKVNELL